VVPAQRRGWTGTTPKPRTARFAGLARADGRTALRRGAARYPQACTVSDDEWTLRDVELSDCPSPPDGE
jgi:hypothetical protein